MTMQQIKRKVELDLENKRDELFNSIDTFVESQKKYIVIIAYVKSIKSYYNKYHC